MQPLDQIDVSKPKLTMKQEFDKFEVNALNFVLRDAKDYQSTKRAIALK